MHESLPTPGRDSAVALLRRMLTYGCYWRSNRWPTEDAWQVDVFHVPNVNMPAWSHEWRPEHFLDILDDYERLLRKERHNENAQSAEATEDAVASCSLRRPPVSGYYPPSGC